MQYFPARSLLEPLFMNTYVKFARRLCAALVVASVSSACITANQALAQDDPYLWLEDVQGEKALAWVKEQNVVTQKRFEAQADFGAIKERVLKVVNSRERIPDVTKYGDWLYNHWTDAQNPRGIWRRTTMTEYKLANPKWETVLDIDALGKSEGVNWVWKGPECDPNQGRCMIALSRGGADAVELREFDMTTKQFVKDGFFLKEAKGGATYVDRDTLNVWTDFGPGSLTKSGYARLVKQWQRGTTISSARTVLEANEVDIGVESYGYERTGMVNSGLMRRLVEFFSPEWHLFSTKTKRYEKLDLPAGTDVSLG
jgi:prolyl oligopeptidase